MATLIWILLPLILFLTLAYQRASLLIWTACLALYLGLALVITGASMTILTISAVLYVLVAATFNLKFLRRLVLTRYIFKIFRKSLPSLSATEKEALAAGTVGWDQELFSGMPNWDKFHAYDTPILTSEEQTFLDGPVTVLCSMIDNWDITHNRFNLPDEIWSFLKENGFFGIIIPKEYGGLGFSAYAHSAILTKIAGKSMSVGSVVAVPNSLGPAELLLHYGTKEQQDHYLPRLACGKEIPCFALTGPEAGSDASAMPDYGIICYEQFEGKQTLGIRLNWDKRYITLAPVATVLGLAFKLYDPDHLVGGKTSLGITCALIPTDMPGITIGRRHYPLNCAFPNGPTQGRNVFIPIDWIIGGQPMAGQGWRMLVECLAAGRAISLPSMASGGAKISAYASGAYARIRNQFHLPIGKFGGVEEALARIAAHTYIMDATRIFTVAAVDRGERPAVPAAISKYHVTELGRKVINDAMDIHGGKGICMGPKNYLASTYQETPISITVEGANILTRSMIIFGQGAIRCHPYVIKEMQAVSCENYRQGLKEFDKAIFSHLGYIMSNAVRSIILGITHSHFVRTPKKPLGRYYQHLTRFSAALALVSDIAMISLGGSLKRREKLSGRLGDVLSMLYLGSAVLKQFDADGYPKDELPVVQWAMDNLLYTAQKSLHEALVNFPIKWLGTLLNTWVFPVGKHHVEASDKLGHQVARTLLNTDSLRHQLAKGAYLIPGHKNPVGFMEEVLQKVIDSESLEQILLEAIRDKRVVGYTYEQRVNDAAMKKVISDLEAAQLIETYRARKVILAVDDFAPEELENRFVQPDVILQEEEYVQ